MNDLGIYSGDGGRFLYYRASLEPLRSVVLRLWKCTYFGYGAG